MIESMPRSRTLAHRRRFKWRGAVGVVLLTPVVILTALTTPIVPPDSWLNLAVDALAWVAFVAGAALRFWATLYVGGKKSVFVVSDGPYSICRHPLYLGSILLVLSGVLFLKSLLCAAALVLVGLAYFQFTAPAEEDDLVARLGAPYKQYRERVNRLWPSFRNFHTPPRIVVDVQALYNEWARASRWLWLPMLSLLVAHLRGVAWWPHLFRLP